MFTLNCKGRLLDLSTPVVMGIINTTPDSFYSNSRKSSIDAVLQQAEQMLHEGAGLLDLGGQSTRPGSALVRAEEERARVLPALEALVQHFPEAILSVDTYYSQVARAAVTVGASLVNDISGGKFDEQMLSTVAALRVPYCCMHLEGHTVADMHRHTIQSPVTAYLLDYFTERVQACEAAGITDIILDPGFGFSKTIEQNFTLLKELDFLRILQKPILLGVSRKSSICNILGITAAEALNGTTVLNTTGLLKGASILRVHDVKEAREAVLLTQMMQ